MRVIDFGNCDWNMEHYAKEATEIYPLVETQVKALSTTVVSQISTANQMAPIFRLSLMDAIEQIAKEKKYCDKAEPFFKNASAVEKMLLLKLSDIVAAKQPTMEKAHVVGVCILFGMEKINTISRTLTASAPGGPAATAPEPERKSRHEEMATSAAALQALVAKYEGEPLTPGMRQFLTQAKLNLATAIAKSTPTTAGSSSSSDKP